jgi:hypothetical protein
MPLPSSHQHGNDIRQSGQADRLQLVSAIAGAIRSSFKWPWGQTDEEAVVDGRME